MSNRNTRLFLTGIAIALPMLALAQEMATSSGILMYADSATGPASASSSEMLPLAPATPAVPLDESVSPTAASAPVAAKSDSAAAKTLIENVAALENEYVETHGKYLQVLPGNRLPAYEKGAVAEKFGHNISDNVEVITYQSPLGYGYQVIYQDNGTTYSIGYGPEAKHRTYTIVPPSNATSSPAVSAPTSVVANDSAPAITDAPVTTATDTAQ